MSGRFCKKSESTPISTAGQDKGSQAATAGSASPAPTNASTGCKGGSASAGDQDLTLDQSGTSRHYILHVPASYDGKKPTPLVLNMHGFLSNYTEQVGLSGMSKVADDQGFVVARPNGLGEPPAWNGGDCCAFGHPEQDDVGFVSALLDRIEQDACIDTARVYATGYSNGGFLSHRLACELGDRIAAIASVAGVLGIPPESCKPGRAVPPAEVVRSGRRPRARAPGRGPRSEPRSA